MNLATMFSSKRPDWETPKDFFEKFNNELHFTLDVCATQANTKCKNFFSPEDDGLSKTWNGICWMNPPYGKEISKWVKKAYEESLSGTTIVGLLPARTDTKWFHDYILEKAEIRFIKGRIKFVGSKNAAPFPSMIVIWNNSINK